MGLALQVVWFLVSSVISKEAWAPYSMRKTILQTSKKVSGRSYGNIYQG